MADSTRSEDMFIITAVPFGPEDPLYGMRVFTAWQNAWSRAVALAWSNPELKKELLENPAAFFKKYCGWTLPKEVGVVVRETPPVDKNGRKAGWDNTEQSWYLEKNVVHMYLPPAPEIEQQSVALAAYVATGHSYPFSTLC